MKDRKLMIEVTDEEYELIKKGVKLSDMKTEDIIYELISRCGSRHIISKDILSGTPDMTGELSIADGIFEFKFKNTTSPRIRHMPYITDPLDPITITIDPMNPASPIIRDKITDEESATTIASNLNTKYSGGKNRGNF